MYHLKKNNTSERGERSECHLCPLTNTPLMTSPSLMSFFSSRVFVLIFIDHCVIPCQNVDVLQFEYNVGVKVSTTD